MTRIKAKTPRQAEAVDEVPSCARRRNDLLMKDEEERLGDFTVAEKLLHFAASSPQHQQGGASTGAEKSDIRTLSMRKTSSEGDCSIGSSSGGGGSGSGKDSSSVPLWRVGSSEGERWRHAVRRAVQDDGLTGILGGGGGEGDDEFSYANVMMQVERILPAEQTAGSGGGGGRSKGEGGSREPLLPTLPGITLTVGEGGHDTWTGASQHSHPWGGERSATTRTSNRLRFYYLCARSSRQWVRDPQLLIAQLGLVGLMAGLVSGFAPLLRMDFAGVQTRVYLYVFL